MKKIPTLFVRDPADMSRVTREVTPGCEWVLAGEGVATVKWDGTSCMIRDGKLFRRRAYREGSEPPEDFIEAGRAYDKVQGWVPCWRDVKADRYHWLAFDQPHALRRDCTCELIGPKVNGNPYGYPKDGEHYLIPHGVDILLKPGGGVANIERTFDATLACLAEVAIEGLVWHHPDGRMAKIKRRDFGLPWPVDVCKPFNAALAAFDTPAPGGEA